MSDLPDEAIEAAAEAMSGTVRLSEFPGAARDFWMKQARLAAQREDSHDQERDQPVPAQPRRAHQGVHR